MQKQAKSTTLSKPEILAPLANGSIINSESFRLYLQQYLPRLLPFYSSISIIHTRSIYNEINTNKIPSQISQALKDLNLDPKVGGKKQCKKSINDQYYRCYDCSLISNSVLCKQCFQYEKHIGHQFIVRSTTNGYCDCGIGQSISQNGFCSRHKNAETQMIDYSGLEECKKMFLMLLSMGISMRVKENILKNDVNYILLFEVLKFMTNLIEKSQFYCQVAKQVLVEPIAKFVHESKSVISLLIETIWPDPVENKIKVLLFELNQSSQLISSTITAALNIISAHKPEMKQKITKLKSSVFAYSSQESNLRIILDEPNLKVLAFDRKKSQIEELRYLKRLMEAINQNFHDLFVEVMRKMTQKIPMSEWIFTNICSPSSTERIINLMYLEDVFKVLALKLPRKDELFQTLIKQSFDLIQQTRENEQILRIFTLSTLIYFDFDLSSLKNMNYYIFKELITSNKYQCHFTEGLISVVLEHVPLLKKTIQQLSESEIKNISFHFMTFKILFIVIEKIYQRSVFEICTDRLNEQLKKVISTGQVNAIIKAHQNLVSFVQNYIFINQNNLLEEIAFMEISKKYDKNKIFGVLRQLALIYQKRHKTQFKEIALEWFQNQSFFKEFMLTEFEPIKTHQVVPKIVNNFSFNSHFCPHDSDQQKITRFKNKINQKAVEKKRDFQQINQQQCSELINTHKNLIGIFIKSAQNKSEKKLVPILNSFIQMLLNLYSETLSGEVLFYLKEVLAKDNIKTILHGLNKDMIKIIIEHQESSSQLSAHHGDKKKSKEFLMKKERRLQQIKSSQQKTMEIFGSSKEVIEEQDQDNVCIICYQKQPKHALQYLCHARYSNNLPKKLMKSNSCFLLFTTCGHLVHEECLKDNIGRNQEYGMSYSCFLCNKKSNMRFPYSFSGFSEKTVHSLLDELQTIVSLQSDRYEEEMTEFYDERCEELPQNSDYKFIITEQNYPYEIFKSIIFSVYIYSLSNSRIFRSFMLPILPNLLQLLSYFASVGNKLTFSLEAKWKDRLVDRIQRNINALISGNREEMLRLKEGILSQQKSENPEVQNLGSIDKVFLKLSGDTHSAINTVKNNSRFSMFQPPKDLIDLKKMSGKCKYCKKITNSLKICLLCSQVSCENCHEWKEHMYFSHGGSTAHLNIESGCVNYEAFNMRYDRYCLYKNYLGQYYKGQQKVEPKDFELSQEDFEKVVEEVVIEKLQSIVEGENQYDDEW